VSRGLAALKFPSVLPIDRHHIAGAPTTPSTIQAVQASWRLVEPIAPTAAELFYQSLFERDPELRKLFKGDMKQQGEKLMQMIGLAVSKLNEPGVLIPALQSLGRRHGGYGVKVGDYATVGAALLATLAKGLGDAFTPEVRAAWTEVYGVMTQVMTEAAAGAKAA
jgi:hemoglobin-like flavoprotein